MQHVIRSYESFKLVDRRFRHIHRLFGFSDHLLNGGSVPNRIWRRRSWADSTPIANRSPASQIWLLEML